MTNRSHGRKQISATLAPRDLIAEPDALVGAWTARVLTLYPEMFPGPLGQSLTGKALRDGLWHLDPIDIRRFASGKHRNVDDTPAGGGAGMVLRADVVGKAVDFAQQSGPAGIATDRARWPLLAMSPRGRPFDQSMAQELSAADGVTILCGRFEGIDERLIEARGIQEVSIGDFVLTGGELAAQALIDATVRLIPRVLGNAASTEEESFSDGLLEHPQYTRPQSWEGRDIPDILLSGNHAAIAQWRKTQSERLTQERRPDLWRAYAAKAASGRPGEDQELSDAHISAENGGLKKDEGHEPS